MVREHLKTQEVKMASLRELLGDAYKENMTLEEIEAVIADLDLIDRSTLGDVVSKKVFDKTASELAALKKRLKELEQSSMTAEEKLQAEMKQAEELQKKYAKELAKLRAKEIFVTSGLSEKDYNPLLDVVVSENEEITVSRAKAMVDVINAQKQAVEKAVKEELLKNTPKPPAGKAGNVDYTKEIEQAREKGDMVALAALIRQQQIMNQNE